MSRLIYALFTVAALVAGSAAAQAGSVVGFFGVGLTAQAARPVALPGVIYRNAVYTPGAVAIGLAAQGYSHILLMNRNSGGYLFSATAANGQRYLITVAAWRGQIVSAVRG